LKESHCHFRAFSDQCPGNCFGFVFVAAVDDLMSMKDLPLAYLLGGLI
jgi:hypothetical protein